MAARHAWWSLLRRGLIGAFLVALAVLLINHGFRIDWGSVAEVIKSYRASTLALAALVAMTSYSLYCIYELLASVFAGHSLSRLRVAAVAFVCYAFNLNLGSLVGGVGLRYRLYTRLGLDAAKITRVLTFAVVTNWIGYSALAGLAFSWEWIALPQSWHVGASALRLLGLALLGAAAFYLVLCAFSHRRVWRVWGRELQLPTLWLALAQMAVSMLNWLLIAAVVYVLFRQRAVYPVVLAALLISAVAGAITHIPAGLGVMEAVFIAVLGRQLGEGTVIASLLAYRAIYYVGPLIPAIAVYLILEGRAHKLKLRDRP